MLSIKRLFKVEYELNNVSLTQKIRLISYVNPNFSVKHHRVVLVHVLEINMNALQIGNWEVESFEWITINES